MRASDHTLADPDELMNFVQSQCRELSGFDGSERYRRMNERLALQSATTIDQLKPLWDLRCLAVRLFDASFEERDIALFQCPLRLFVDNFYAPERLALPRLLGEVDRDKLVRVFDYWSQAIPLTPPLVTILKNGRFGKWDGFHRIAAAIVVGAQDLMFWSDRRPTFAGVSQIDPLSSKI